MRSYVHTDGGKMSAIMEGILTAMQYVVSGVTDDDSATLAFSHKEFGDFEIIVRRPLKKKEVKPKRKSKHA